ncbi:hypothetical protein ACB094_06G180600 [Castanea mollissima]
MAGLCKLWFISILLLLLFPDFNTCSSPPSSSPVHAPVPNPTPSSPPTVVPPQSPPPPPPSPTTRGSSSCRGLNGGQKAGIAIGVMSGGLVYKKRRSNIRRAKFGVAARSPVL